MSKHDLRAPDYLGHILEACDRILAYTATMTHDAFLKNGLVQDAVLRNIQILGEAANNLLDCWPEIADVHPEVSWIDIYGMRNRVTHGYFLVNLEVVWNVIEIDVPQLRTQIQGILDSPDVPNSPRT